MSQLTPIALQSKMYIHIQPPQNEFLNLLQ